MRPLLRLLWLVLALPAAAPAAAPRPDPAPPPLLGAALGFGDARWDEAAGLLWSPAPGEVRVHRLRESVWYALGLLQRAGPGDVARAGVILEHALTAQFAAPGQPWDGTFARSPEEPAPGPGAQLWRNFDPNWRQFIGSTFVLILEQHGDRLAPELRARLLASIRRAVEGELEQGRAEPYHTNIKLMHAFLLGWAGARLERPDWVARAEALAGEIAAAFRVHGTFEEYNSPTYYGVDFYGLALWRRYGATPTQRALGAELEAGLWRDVGRFYHAGLRNQCGPFDRAYGFDQRKYVSLTGAWMALALPAGEAPLPDPAGPMEHAHDFFAVPLYVALGARVPDDVLPDLRTFRGERTLRRPIEGPRVATAWLGEHLMLGGEITGGTREAGPASRFGQFIPATAHWRVGADDVGWIALRECPPVDAVATPHRLEITTARGDLVFLVHAAGLEAAGLSRDRWTLPGLTVAVDTDAAALEVEARPGHFRVTLRQATRVALAFQLPP